MELVEPVGVPSDAPGAGIAIGGVVLTEFILDSALAVAGDGGATVRGGGRGWAVERHERTNLKRIAFLNFAGYEIVEGKILAKLDAARVGLRILAGDRLRLAVGDIDAGGAVLAEVGSCFKLFEEGRRIFAREEP